ncbi:MAG: hypothetical protein MUC88_18845 [Planctomycetes bacterium]|jgi:hypothetical protein|nr:hypothetical protein [Planctomycetota bacterium]
MPVAYPLKSATWVNIRTVRLALCFNRCGTLCKTQDECTGLKMEDGKTYNLIGGDALNEKIGPTGQFHFDDRVRVQGLLQVRGPRHDAARDYEERYGDVHGPIIVICIPPKEDPDKDCPEDCAGKFKARDRVKLLVSDPPGPDGKPATSL